MLDPNKILALSPWQQEFVSRFVSEPRTKSLLVAAPGTGKTTSALIAASKMLKQGLIDSTLVITGRVVLKEQWRHAAARCGITLEQSLDRHFGEGASVTLQSLRAKGAEATLGAAAKARRWLIIADDIDYEAKSFGALVDRMLKANRESKALFISTHVPSDLSFESEFRFRTEFILDRSIIEAPATELRVARFAPSFSLLRQLQKGIVDDLSWREFEKLIATLLEKDGYAVELMEGSKDGGVDVIAVKDLGASGYFKTLWQAKKHRQTNKVGISLVRELADTRHEFGASKGVIVTSSYLTKGALQRVERDKYILGKVDRDDLDAWIRRTLFAQK